MISQELKKEMDQAITRIMTSYNEWDLSREEKRSLSIATEHGITDLERVGRVCDMLTTFGVQDKDEFDGFYSLVRELPDE